LPHCDWLAASAENWTVVERLMSTGRNPDAAGAGMVTVMAEQNSTERFRTSEATNQLTRTCDGASAEDQAQASNGDQERWHVHGVGSLRKKPREPKEHDKNASELET
jgi:hypothetical protein